VRKDAADIEDGRFQLGHGSDGTWAGGGRRLAELFAAQTFAPGAPPSCIWIAAVVLCE
jgi:hypothetical protein